MARTRALAVITTVSLIFPRVAADYYATGGGQGYQAGGGSVTWSLPSQPLYLQQQECVQACFWHTDSPGQDDVLNAIVGCSPPWTNECFCEPKSASIASGFLSNCVAVHCTASATAGAPLPTALSVYNNYCASNGFSIPTVASIASFSAYSSQPNCVQDCLWLNGSPAPSGLVAGAACNSPWWDNACLCNSALASANRAYLSACVATKCSTVTNAPQVTAAVSVHGEYCSCAGLELPALAAVAPATSAGTAGGGAQGLGTGTGTTSTPPATVTVEVQQGSGLSTGAIAGIATGSIAAVIGLIAAAAFIMYKRRTALPSQTLPLVTKGAQHSYYPPHWPGIHEKPTDLPAVEADFGTPRRQHELPS